MAPLKPGPKPIHYDSMGRMVDECGNPWKKLDTMNKKLIKKKERILEKLYERLFKLKGTWYILSEKDIDELYENVMEHLGVFNKKTNSFVEEWSEEGKKMNDIFWDWYIKLIKKKLKISKYYEKFYKR